MYCPRCKNKNIKSDKIKMKNSKRKFHKKTKWVCPNCGLVRMQEDK